MLAHKSKSSHVVNLTPWKKNLDHTLIISRAHTHSVKHQIHLIKMISRRKQQQKSVYTKMLDICEGKEKKIIEFRHLCCQL
jgi:hypothetical protein